MISTSASTTQAGVRASPIVDAAHAPVRPARTNESSDRPDTPGGIRLQTRWHWLVVLVVWGLSAAYTASYLKRGWVPHDEGALAQGATRVLEGELPHRDFDEIYTGGLSFLNAFAFRVLGTNLATLRIVLFVFFLAWVPAVYSIASRFASASTAGGITLLAVAWSLPNYAAAVPSWYSLFFAVFGIAALLRHLEAGSRWWVLAAGVCGGLSIVVKVIGLYYVAAVVLFLIFREQGLAREAPAAAKRGRIYSAFVAVVVLLFVILLSATVRNSRGTAEIIHFVLPGAALAALVLWHESKELPGRDRERFRALFQALVPFTVGVALPIGIFLIPYVLSGSVAALVKGVLTLPAKRLNFAVMAPPGLTFTRPLLPPYLATEATLSLLILVATGMFLRTRVSRFYWSYCVAVALGLGVILGVSNKHQLVYLYAWYSLSFSIPLTVLLGVLLLRAPAKTGKQPALHQQQLMLLLSITAICSLVQFPFAAPIYFSYVAPLLALAVLAVVSSCHRPPHLLLGSLLWFYLLFAVLRVTPGFIYAMGNSYQPNPQTQRLTVARAGGLRVDPREAQEYDRLIQVISEHARGEFMYAAPDCPEVYFLAGLRNPTRTLFDFFDEQAGRTERILSELEARQVKVVVILNAPAFSLALAADLRAALRKRFPDSTTVGRFQVRWRP